jgi:hypothetical protein
MRGAFVLTAFLTACAHQAAPAADPEPAPAAVAAYTPARDPLIGPAWVQATGAYVVERCNRHSGADAPTEGDPPSIHVVDAGGGIEVRQACGLITYELYTPAYALRFKHEVCGIADDGPMSDECSKRFSDMFIARLSERYASANWTAVSQHCTAYPLECNTPLGIERNLLASHNAGIQAWYAGAVAYVQARQQVYAQQEAQAQAQAVEEHREERRRFWRGVGNALSAMGQAAAQQPQQVNVHVQANCTSNTYAGTTSTNCY